MECENELCLYEQKGKCTLEKIALDIIGQCTSCIYVEIPKKDLEKYKNIHKNRIENY